MLETDLRSAVPLRTLDDAALADIAGHAAERRLAPGEPLFEQGEPARRFYLVAEGRLKVTMLTRDGKQFLVRLLQPGDFCGLAFALDRPDFPASCHAVVAARVVGWPTTYWQALAEEHPGIGISIALSLGRYVEDMHRRMSELATEPVERRVAHAVLRLARDAGKPTDGGVSVDFPVTRQDLAEMAGTTLHSVSRIVSAWSDRGIVRRGRARIVVSDLAGLERIARGGEG